MIERRFCHHDPVEYEYEYEYEYRCTEYEYDCPDEQRLYRLKSSFPHLNDPLRVYIIRKVSQAEPLILQVW